MNKNNLRKRCLFTALLISITQLTACSEQTTEEVKLRPVKHIIVQSGTGVIRDRVFSGTAQSSQEANLSFKVSGTVKRVAVEVGDQVKQGDLIAELDDATYKLEYEQALASAAQSNAKRRSAESEYNRVRQLYTNDNASTNELDTALADAESAKAQYNADLQNAQLAKLNLDYTRLLVDVDCSIAEVNIDANENIQSGQSVAKVSCGENWEIEIAVPESLIASFSRGLKGKVQFASLPGQVFDGLVTEVGIGTSDSSTFPITLSLIKPPPTIRSNLAAEVLFQFDNISSNASTFYVPASAVVSDELGTYVYVMEPGEASGTATLRRRPVETGEISSLGLEVTDGLKDGEKIIVAGQVNAREGMLVRDN